MYSIKIVRINVESIQHETLSFPDRHSTEMLAGKLSLRDTGDHNVAGLVAQKRFISGSMADRESIFVRGAHLPRTVADGADDQRSDTLDLDPHRRTFADTGGVHPMLFWQLTPGSIELCHAA